MNQAHDQIPDEFGDDGAPENGLFGFSLEQLARNPTVYRSDLLAGRVFIVTGGGTGFGQAMTFLLSRLGAQVVICSRREENLIHTAKAVKELVGADVYTRVCNIREPEQVEALFEDVWARYGRVDTVVNNAGGQFPIPALDMSRNGWKAVIDLNLNGTWWMMQTAGRHWRDKKMAGNIVNIVAYIERGMPQVIHTCAARAGVIYMSKSVAQEWAELKIRVNCLAPGCMASEGLKVYAPEASARMVNSNPMHKVGDAWDVAEGVVYLSAPSAKFITGEMLVIDGGMQMWGNAWPGGVPDWFKVI